MASTPKKAPRSSASSRGSPRICRQVIRITRHPAAPSALSRARSRSKAAGGPVDGASVQLRNHTRTAPHAVRLHEPVAHRNGDVELGLRQTPASQEPQKALFQLAPRDGGADVAGGEDRADRRGTAPPWVAGKQGWEGEGVRVSLDLRLVHRPLERRDASRTAAKSNSVLGIVVTGMAARDSHLVGAECCSTCHVIPWPLRPRARQRDFHLAPPVAEFPTARPLTDGSASPAGPPARTAAIQRALA